MQRISGGGRGHPESGKRLLDCSWGFAPRDQGAASRRHRRGAGWEAEGARRWRPGDPLQAVRGAAGAGQERLEAGWSQRRRDTPGNIPEHRLHCA